MSNQDWHVNDSFKLTDVRGTFICHRHFRHGSVPGLAAIIKLDGDVKGAEIEVPLHWFEEHAEKALPKIVPGDWIQLKNETRHGYLVVESRDNGVSIWDDAVRSAKSVLLEEIEYVRKSNES